MNLLIHADPGARSQFLYAWITDQLYRPAFDIGSDTKIKFHKIHRLDDPNYLKTFNGVKIRITPKKYSIDLHSLLFLRKNIHVQFPDFTKNEYCLETFTKLYEFSKEIFQWDSELDHTLYDHIIDFDDTFDNDFMLEFYHMINGRKATPAMIQSLTQTNRLNRLDIDKNHASSILKLVITQEDNLGLEEKHRFWSIVDVYQNTPVDGLHDEIQRLITPENYGILLC